MSSSAAADVDSQGAGGDNVEIVYDNTYRMKPEEDQRFLPYEVEALIKQTVETKLKKVSWDEEKCKTLSTDLCNEIKKKVKGKPA